MPDHHTPLPDGLITKIRHGFCLAWDGIHGAAHWARVWGHGRWLCQQTGADPQVVHLFALLHDSQRVNDGDDPLHGQRAAEFASNLFADGLLPLTRIQLDLLKQACSGHSSGERNAPVTVQACWDADRLDLGRVGIRPDPRRLCTAAARSARRIELAWRWSLGISPIRTSKPSHIRDVSACR